MIPVYLSQSPAGISSKQMIHYAQSYTSGKFRKYDHGFVKNLEVYGMLTPPEYNLSKTTAPVAIYYGESDTFVDSIDVTILYEKISNPRGLYKVPKKEINHLDFLWGMNALTLIYEPVLKLMKDYEKTSMAL